MRSLVDPSYDTEYRMCPTEDDILEAREAEADRQAERRAELLEDALMLLAGTALTAPADRTISFRFDRLMRWAGHYLLAMAPPARLLVGPTSTCDGCDARVLVACKTSLETSGGEGSFCCDCYGGDECDGCGRGLWS